MNNKTMVVLSQIEGQYELGECIGEETIIREYKEFYLTDTLDLKDIDDLSDGFLSHKVQDMIYKSLIDYTDKYFDRYLLSLANISKIHLPSLLNHTHSKICVGVSDSGIITGIPLHSSQIDNLKIDIVEKVINHYSNIIGLHNKKGDSQINLDGETYYDFSKLVQILKKHTRVNIHRVSNKNNINPTFINSEG